jgi:beta-lactamase class A
MALVVRYEIGYIPHMKWLVLLVFSVGILGLGIVLSTNLWKPEETAQETQPEETYSYLAKRIFLENPSDVIINFTDLREQLRGYIAGFEPVKIGVYFEYLFSGQIVGINDREVFYVASLPKIPMAMEALKQIEEGKISPDEMLIIEKGHLDDAFGTLWKKGTGAKISVNEALKLSVVESDNTAYKLLKDRVGDEDLTSLYSYLDIPQDKVSEGRGITPKNYSSILKCIYFSCYLSYEHSNNLLDIMALPSEMDRIKNSVPQDIKVANKFGIYTVLGEEENQVYSDCGIVYVPQRRYILCVMVRGAKVPDEAGKRIEDISKIVYDFVEAANIPSTSKK